MRRAALAILLMAAASPVLAAPPIRALLIDGESGGPYHDWKATTPVLKQELEETGLFAVDVCTLPSRPDFAGYRVVISNYDAADWPADLRSDFEIWMRNGGGFVSVHAADNAFPDWPAYNEMIGMGGWRKRDETAGPLWYFRDGKLVSDTTTKGPAGAHGARVPFAITVREPEHPIVKGLPPVWMHQSDELYRNLRGPGQNLTVLATAFDGKDEPILMTVTWGKGRIFHTTLGHDIAALTCIGFITMFQRGAEWAATGNVTQKVPASFPTANSVSYRTDLH